VRERLDKSDIIWCFGGSTDWLAVVFEKTAFIGILPEILEKKVWVGSSAGSCIMGARNSLKCDTEIYANEKYFDVKDFLRIVDGYIYPHFWGECTRPGAYASLLEQSKKDKTSFYALSDKSALIVEGERQYLFGKKAQKLSTAM
jgi:peptidase E